MLLTSALKNKERKSFKVLIYGLIIDPSALYMYRNIVFATL